MPRQMPSTGFLALTKASSTVSSHRSMGCVIILRESVRLFTVIAGERIVSSWQQQAAAQRDDLLHLGALDERDQDDRQGEKRITQRPVQEPALVLLQRLQPAHDS